MQSLLRRLVLPAVCLLTLLCSGCQTSKTELELFLVSVGDGQTVRYGRRSADISNWKKDPDTVARGLLASICEPAILHSTSWRWEKDGRLVLTYIAYSDDGKCQAGEDAQLAWSELLPPQATDPKKPRPAVIRPEDVLAHGLRHITFLVRHSPDDRLRAVLTPSSLAFFRSICGQLAGRFETAREFADCSAVTRHE